MYVTHHTLESDKRLCQSITLHSVQRYGESQCPLSEMLHRQATGLSGEGKRTCANAGHHSTRKDCRLIKASTTLLRFGDLAEPYPLRVLTESRDGLMFGGPCHKSAKRDRLHPVPLTGRTLVGRVFMEHTHMHVERHQSQARHVLNMQLSLLMLHKHYHELIRAHSHNSSWFHYAKASISDRPHC